MTEHRPIRSEPEAFRARELNVALTVNDIARSLTFYCDQVGFHLKERYEQDGALRGAALVAGEANIMISQDDGALGTDRVKGQGMRLYFSTVQDVDEFAATIEARGGTLAVQPRDMPWGARAFDLVDPDGFKITIAQSEEL
ncbi:MAG: VOC family protein [Longimicrobiales bacterium]